MQYFTPELFVRLQNLEDSSAMQEWDRAAERYSSALEQVLPRFPPSLRKFAGEGILRDAEVLSITQSRDNLSITLQPELEDGHLLVLSYALVEDPQLSTAVLPERYRTEYSSWMYDEFSLSEPSARLPSRRKRGAAQRNGRVPVYCHDILLTNGWELVLRFRQFKVIRPLRLLPAPRSAKDGPAGTLSQSA
jgi:hypothetical protein